MQTLHVRSVPDELYDNLRSLAQDRQRSLSAQVILMLDRALVEEQRRQEQTEILETVRRRRFTPPPYASFQRGGLPTSPDISRHVLLPTPRPSPLRRQGSRNLRAPWDRLAKRRCFRFIKAPGFLPVKARKSTEQTQGVGMLWIFVEIIDQCDFYRTPTVHDHHPVSDSGHDTQVVSDPNHCHPKGIT